MALAGLVAARRRAGVWVLACATASLMLISTQFGEVSPWRWVHAHVPGAGGIRAISRISMILALAVPVGIALLADPLARARRYAGLTAIALLCLVEQPRAPFPQVSKVETIFDAP